MQWRKVLHAKSTNISYWRERPRVRLWFLSRVLFLPLRTIYAKFLLESPAQKTEELSFKIATLLFSPSLLTALFASSENRVPITLRNNCTHFDTNVIFKITQRLKDWVSSNLQIFWNQRKRLHEQDNIFPDTKQFCLLHVTFMFPTSW